MERLSYCRHELISNREGYHSLEITEAVDVPHIFAPEVIDRTSCLGV